jgi:Thymidylate synthase complementing protein.
MEYLVKVEHPSNPQMFAAVVQASVAENSSSRIVTMHLRYPRIIHGEVMTHRVFSRNARSSRAVPVKTMLNEVRNTPFVPWHWGKNQKGMQANEECNEPVHLDWEMVSTGIGELPERRVMTREGAWLWARDKAVEAADAYMDAGYHKQVPNRLLEPFSWIDTLITSTSWANFLHLRDHGDAEPHFQDLAKLVRKALEEVRDKKLFQNLLPGEWHLPYITESDREFVAEETDGDIGKMLDMLLKISAARCARISYTPFDGNASYEREIERFNLLVTSERIHASPTEHQATPDVFIPHSVGWANPNLAGNLGPGWIQFRKTLRGENHNTDSAFWNGAA